MREKKIALLFMISCELMITPVIYFAPVIGVLVAVFIAIFFLICDFSVLKSSLMSMKVWFEAHKERCINYLLKFRRIRAQHVWKRERELIRLQNEVMFLQEKIARLERIIAQKEKSQNAADYLISYMGTQPTKQISYV